MARPRGLDWEPAEYELLQTLARAFNKAQPRGPHTGQWVKVGGGGALSGGVDLPAPERVRPGSPTQREGGVPSPGEMANMIAGLRQQLVDQEARLDSAHRQQLQEITARLASEEHKIAREAAREVTEAEKAAEKRKKLIKLIAVVLGLIAAGALIIATAGLALPPLTEAAVAVGPVIGGEVIGHIVENRRRR